MLAVDLSNYTSPLTPQNLQAIKDAGVGLAIVQDVALAHGAELLLTGRSEGSGAVFSVRFPPCPQEE